MPAHETAIFLLQQQTAGPTVLARCVTARKEVTSHEAGELPLHVIDTWGGTGYRVGQCKFGMTRLVTTKWNSVSESRLPAPARGHSERSSALARTSCLLDPRD